MGLWSRSSIFLVAAFKIFAQDRVQPLLRTFQLVLMLLWMRLVRGVFALFPKIKKCEVGFALGVGTGRRLEPILCRVLAWLGRGKHEGDGNLGK